MPTNTNVMPVMPDDTDIKHEIQVVEHQAMTILVDDEPSKLVACDLLTTIRKQIRAVKEFFRPMKQEIDKAKKAVLDREKSVLDVLEKIDRHVADQLSEYAVRMEAERRERERIARDQAEAERVQAEAERQALLEMALAEKDDEYAIQLMDEPPVFIPDPIILADTQKTVKTDDGSMTMVADIQVAITDQKLFIKAVLDGLAPITAIDIKIQPIKSWVRAMGLKGPDVQKYGISVREIMIPRVRGK